MKFNYEVDNQTRQHVRKCLAKYNEYKRELEELQEDIVILNDVEGEKPVRFTSNKQLRFRTEFVRVVGDILENCDVEIYEIIRLRYFYRGGNCWDYVAMNVDGYTESNCRKLEKNVIDEIAVQLGW